MILVLLILVSCGQRVSVTRTPKATPQIDELLDSPVAIFQAEMDRMNEERSIGMPTLDESIEYIAEYNITKTLEFPIEEGGSKFTCKYSFKKAKITETIKEVSIKDYSVVKVFIPVDPTYTGAEITSWKTKCLIALNNGAKSVKNNYSIDTQLSAFKKFVRVNLIDPVQKCIKRTPPTFYTCTVDKLEVTPSSNEFLDFFRMNFVGRVKGKAVGISASVNFEKIYFSNYGIFGFSFDSLNPSGFSGITKLTLEDWKH